MTHDSIDYISPNLSVITRDPHISITFCRDFHTGVNNTEKHSLSIPKHFDENALYREYSIERQNRVMQFPVQLVKQTVKRRAAVNAFPFFLNSRQCRARAK